MAKITIKQHDITDCGATCFVIHFDLQVSISVNVLTNNQVTKIFGGSYFLKNNLFVARKLH